MVHFFTWKVIPGIVGVELEVPLEEEVILWDVRGNYYQNNDREVSWGDPSSGVGGSGSWENGEVVVQEVSKLIWGIRWC